ncbi:Sensor protein kinase WalK [compost metagenome]
MKINLPPESNFISNEIAENEQRYRALVSATSDIIYRMSPDWEEMRELDGRGFLKDTLEPITGWLEKYILPEDKLFLEAAIAAAVEEKRIFHLEHRVLRADGNIGWTLSRAVPILDGNGEIIEWFGTASDISEAKRVEQALREAKEQSEQQRRLYETIVSNTPDLMYVFDLDYRFIYANAALLAMWGKTWDEAIGKGLLENGYEPWHATMHEREIDQVRDTRKSIRGEVSFPHAELGRRVYDYIFTPVINQNGEVEAVAGTTRDITEIRQNEQRKNDFIGMVSHELKTPLTSMVTYLQLMERQVKGKNDPLFEKAIIQSLKQTRRMTNMINGFLHISRLESGQLAFEKSCFDIRLLITELEEEIKVLYSTHKFEITGAQQVMVEADREKIAQVLVNLLNNAVKYARRESTIHIHFKTLEHFLLVSVRDEGRGIAPDELSKLFDRYYRGERNHLIAGFGIGLYLCKEIIDGHHGEIWAESVVGEGSTFNFTLPLC